MYMLERFVSDTSWHVKATFAIRFNLRRLHHSRRHRAPGRIGTMRRSTHRKCCSIGRQNDSFHARPGKQSSFNKTRKTSI